MAVTLIPAPLDRAAADPKVRGCLPVYIRLFAYLDYAAYRSLKQVVLARELGVSQQWVSQALDILHQHGYVMSNGLGYRLTAVRTSRTSGGHWTGPLAFPLRPPD